MVATRPRAEDGGVEYGNAQHELEHVSNGHRGLLAHPEHGRAPGTVGILDAPLRDQRIKVEQGHAVDDDVEHDVEYLSLP